MSSGPRGREIYISAKTKQRLFWIKQLDALEFAERTNSEGMLTVDEIADRLLNAKIEEMYPNIKTLEKRLNALEDQLVTELLSPTEEK